MIASVHLADASPRASFRLLGAQPKVSRTPGLRQAHLALTARLGPSVLPHPSLRRVGLIAFWDDDAALDRFESDDPLAAELAAGWSVRLDPLRAGGSWPGLPTDLTSSRSVPHDGPVAALTLGRLRLSQGLRFLRASARAEGAALAAPGLRWATGFGRPPLVSTFSLWDDSRALATYAYGRTEPAHPDAITASEIEPFHTQQAFIRFRPYAASGRVSGANPLEELGEIRPAA
ncbi:MAG TPA: hypothetical protein VMH24_08765 [Candidatus Sulfotelmatobacter sp.]|nr:hypothetical protein [Candidatus Sulfotelmatobacter sp.]